MDTEVRVAGLITIFGFYGLYYWLKAAKKPSVICSNRRLRDYLEKACPVLTQKFWPTCWAVETRLQTVVRHFLQRRIAHNFERQLVPLPDGGLVAFDWLNPTGFESKDDNAKATTPIVVVLPGLNGDSKESYIGHVVNEINRNGFRAAVLIYRGFSDLPLKTPRVHCAASSDDLAWGLHEISLRYPKAPLYGCGFSLGGILWYNYLGKCQPANKCLVRACITISMPWHLSRSMQSIEKPINVMAFNRNLAKTIATRLQTHLDVFENDEHASSAYDIQGVFKAGTLREVEQAVICPMYGFETPEHYYEAVSPWNYFRKLPCPVVSINAADDVFALEETIPIDEIASFPTGEGSGRQKFGPLALILTSRGGHLGFAEGWWPTKRTWADRLAGQLLMALHSYTSENAQ